MTDTEIKEGWFSDETATLGDRLTAAREAAGLSQKDLARSLGVKAKTVNNWESDASEPRGSRAQMLSGLLGVSIIWLLTGAGKGVAEPGTGQAETAARLAIAETRRIRKDIDRLSDRLKRLETQMTQALTEASNG